MTTFLITGPNGFVGQSLRNYLTKQGSEVRCISKKELAECIASNNPGDEQPVLIHTAWAGVSGKYRNSEEQNINEEITCQVIKLAEAYNAKKVIAFGSQAEYGNPNIRVDESYPTSPTTLYGKLKIKCHNILRSSLGKMGIDLCWLRLYDPYGPGDNPSWFMPYVIACALQGESPELTECTQYWDYIYIEDVCRCVKILSGCNTSRDSTYNLSSDIPVRLRDVVEYIYAYAPAHKGRPQFGKVPFRSDQVFYLQGNNGKLKREVGWIPLVSIKEGIRRTVEYFNSEAT